jgi:hypothetical protein
MANREKHIDKQLDALQNAAAAAKRAAETIARVCGNVKRWASEMRRMARSDERRPSDPSR